VFRHCEGKDSIETIRCTYQANLMSTKKTQRLKEGKDGYCILFMSDAYICIVQVLCCTSAKWTTLFPDLNALTRFLRLQTTEWKILNHVSSICLRETLIDEAKLYDQYQNLFEFVRNEHQPNAIYYKMMEHERWAKYFATCNAIECFS